MLDVRDLITGRLYHINLNQICYLTRYKNDANANVYTINLADGTSIATTKKLLNRIRRQMQENSIVSK